MPITEATAALIAGGMSAASSAGASIAGGKMNKRSYRIAKNQLNQNKELYEKQLAYNENAAKMNRDFIESYYNKYESPEAMMRQYGEAGINPYLYSGGANSQIASSMGNNPEMDSSQLMVNNASAASGMQGALQNQANNLQNSIQTSFSQQLSAYNAYLDAESKKQDVDRKKIDNLIAQYQAWNAGREATPEDMANILGFGVDSDWSNAFFERYGHRPRLADMYATANYLTPLASFNRNYGFESIPQNPFYRMYNAVMARRNAYPWEDKNGRLMPDQPSFGRWDNTHSGAYGETGQNIANFLTDLYQSSLGYQINDARFKSWQNDYNKRLLSRGINPNGNGYYDRIGQFLLGPNDQFGNDLVERFRQQISKATGEVIDFFHDPATAISNGYKDNIQRQVDFFKKYIRK